MEIIVDDVNNATSCANKNKELYYWWKENNNKITFLQKLNKKEEENKMIESINLIDLYANEKIEKINNELLEKSNKIAEENMDVINKYNELVEEFHKNCDNLYLSQFNEEEKNNIITNQFVDDSNKQLRRTPQCITKYKVNDSYRPDECKKVLEEANKQKEEIAKYIKRVKAHVGIAKTKEEVEEILTRYDIIDKKGKLVTK